MFLLLQNHKVAGITNSEITKCSDPHATKATEIQEIGQLIIYSIILVVFYCSSDIDCNNKGICKNGECDCNPGWDTDEELDCTGKNPLNVA